MSAESSTVSYVPTPYVPPGHWPHITGIFHNHDHTILNPDFFSEVPIEYLVLARLGYETCDMRLYPHTSVLILDIVRVKFASSVLRPYGWVVMDIYGPVHLTRPIHSARRDVLAFQGWCLDLAYQADTNNRANFNPCIIYLPRSCFMEPVVPQPARTWMYVWESVISCFKSMSWYVLIISPPLMATRTLHSKHGGGCPTCKDHC
ncbi:hypothetical protein EVJ58_g954 [Rhodofomes roseus]|uniref:Uncharacterized protein n=1 Tax=Rhodofomes roseus TaxID=34475 RepID=A0A4Y9Z218_9APHY|nr:hypothetical protein EVJ58_g954 [Rhodofomes roseus]